MTKKHFQPTYGTAFDSDESVVTTASILSASLSIMLLVSGKWVHGGSHLLLLLRPDFPHLPRVYLVQCEGLYYKGCSKKCHFMVLSKAQQLK